MTKNEGHKEIIDIARIIGALAVVAIHVTDGLVILPNHFGGVSWWWANVINSSSRVAVPLFVMISGYLLLDPKKNIDKNSFIVNRLKRVGIPLLFWSFFYFIWRWYFWKEIFTVNDIVYKFFSLSLFHLYFLIVIAGLYLFTPIIREQIKNYSFRQLLRLILISLVLSTFITTFVYIFPQFKLARNMITIPFIFLGYYLFGVYVKNIKLNKMQYVTSVLIYGVLGISTSILVYLNTKYKFFWVDNFGQYFHESFSPIIIAMSLILFMIIMNSEIYVKKLANRYSLFLKQMAATTLGIYIIHPVIIDVVNTYFRFDIHHISSSLWLYISFKIFLIFFVSYLIVSIYQRSVKLIKSI